MKQITIALVIASAIATGIVGILGSQLVQPAFAQQCVGSSSSGSTATGANADSCAAASGATSAVCTLAVVLGIPINQCTGTT